MGFNTTVLILNDQLSDIEDNPALFVDRLSHAIQGAEVYVPGQTTVMPTAHADRFRLYGTQGNLILDLSTHSQDTMALVEGRPVMRELVLGMITQAEAELHRLKTRLQETDG